MSDPSPDLEQIRLVLARYCQLCDDGRFEEWAELYTADASFHVMGRSYEGRAAIRSFIEAGQPPERRGKHVCANPIIELDEAGGRATATTDYIFVGRTAEGLAVTSAGRYHDTFVRDEGIWRFARREIVFMGDEPAA
jgi:3-phenylpropionate/cinnamic acid dioxygenase small subunit